MTTPKESALHSIKPNSESKTALEKAQYEAKAALEQLKTGEKARVKAEAALAEVRKELVTARSELEEVRLELTILEKELHEAHKVMGETKTEIEREHQARLKAEQVLKESFDELGEGTEQRVSFVVRLTVGQRGKVLRTEVEHAQSGKKDGFQTLDLERMAAFMEGCISSLVVPQVEPKLDFRSKKRRGTRTIISTINSWIAVPDSDL